MADEKYDQAFFLALAAKGKDTWNAWRRDPANKDVRVTFEGIDFSEAPMDGIDFSGFEFGKDADFSACRWSNVELMARSKTFKPGRACFSNAGFGRRVSFSGTVFGDGATFVNTAFGTGTEFTNATFGFSADFTGALFGEGTSFTNVTFGDGADFSGAVFAIRVNFDSASFGVFASFSQAYFSHGAGFRNTVFHEGADFSRTTFESISDFSGATFGGGISFTDAAFGDEARFGQTYFKDSVSFAGCAKEQWVKRFTFRQGTSKDAHATHERRHKEAWETYGSGPDRFLRISFANARFNGKADFLGRSFEQTADFTTARFYSPPDFDAVTNASRIDFTGAHVGFGRPLRFHWTSETKVPFRLRALRKIAEETKNHDLERDLYIEERKAERGVYWHQLVVELKKQRWTEKPLIAARLIAHLLWILVMGFYWALADYGRSFVRPLAGLIAGVFFFDWRYGGILAPLTPKVCPLGDKYEHAVGMLALGNAVPFVGPLTIDAEIKKFLFCPRGDVSCLPPIPPEWFQFLVIAQNVLSIILVFFIGLALRNYFRIK